MCHGQPCVKGTRVLITVLLDALAASLSAVEIVRHYPSSPKRTCERRQPTAPGWRNRRFTCCPTAREDQARRLHLGHKADRVPECAAVLLLTR
ncbi:MAG: DUF433 domain-containing protein [Egibacteraceae bacterium]